MMRYLIRKENFGSVIYDRQNYNYLFADKTVTDFLNDNINSETILNNCGCADISSFFIEGKVNYDFINYKNSKLCDSDLLFAAPLQLYLDITTKCNLNCKHCYNNCQSNLYHHMDLKSIKNIADEMVEMGVFKISLGGGEPFEHPEWMKILTLFLERNIDVSISTNGTFLDQKEVLEYFSKQKIRTISISIDGFNKDSYEQVRGIGTFDRLQSGLIKINEVYNGRISARVTLTAPVCREINQTLNLLEKLEFKFVKFKALQLYGRALKNSWLMPSFDLYHSAIHGIENEIDNRNINISLPSQFRATDHSYKHFVNKYIPLTFNGIPAFNNKFGCSGGKIGAYITANGDMTPCVSFGSKYFSGNIKDHGIAYIWHNGEGFNNVREVKSDAVCTICTKLHFCKGGCRARALACSGFISAHDPYCPNKERI